MLNKHIVCIHGFHINITSLKICVTLNSCNSKYTHLEI